jgi:L-asparaginase II
MQVLAEVERSGFVESRHLGAVVVADAGGAVQAAVGDPAMPVYLRSSAKLPQALAVWRLGPQRELGLDEVALAGAAGSHAGEPVHVASVRKVLAAAALDEGALRCPPVLPLDADARREADGPAAIYHNCSGKHAYMLAGAVAMGWDPARYTAAEHPVQVAASETIAELAGTTIQHVGVDGCGVPVHALPLRALATIYARLGARAAAGEEGPAALLAALRRHPVMIAGSGRLDTVLLEATGGRVLAKAGAEGVAAAVDLMSGHGLAVKVLDGTPRARGPALVAALRALHWRNERELEAAMAAATSPVHGGGETVGVVRPAPLELPAT